MAWINNGNDGTRGAASIFNLLNPDDDQPPRPIDRRAASTPSEPPANFDTVPDQDDDPETLLDLQRRSAFGRRANTPVVTWAADADQPDFAHLLVAEAKGIKAPKTFKFTPAVLDLLIQANSFQPDGTNNTIVFALRGGKLSNTREAENVPSVDIDNTRPDHQNFRCTIGYYHRTTGLLSAFLASTVPNRHYMEGYYNKKNNLPNAGSTSANIVPSGCYVFRVNAHKQGKIKPALRMTDPDKQTEDAVVTVLRTFNDLTFKHDDFWDMTQPFDNIHCAYRYDEFSSAGCLTIQGPNGEGPWGKFQKVLGSLGWDRRIDVVLLTGQEAAIAAQIIAEGRQNDKALVDACLRRLRLGSQGNAVTLLQQKLGSNGTGYFGPATRIAMVNAERSQHSVNSDSIYSPQDDAVFGWNVFSGAPATQPGTAASGAGAGTLGAGAVGIGTGAALGAGSAPGTGSTGSTGTTATSGSTGTRDFDPDSLVFIDGPIGSALSPDGKQMTVPGEGVWSVGPVFGKITFTPEPGFAGKPQPVRYQIADRYGHTASAQVAVNVIAVNKPPQVNPDVAHTLSGEAVSIAVLQNDVDLDGQLDPGSVRFVSPSQNAMLTADGKTLTVPGEGVWSVDAHGEVRFAPMPDFTGIAVVTYQVANNRGTTGTSTVTVTVDPHVEPPKLADDMAEGEAGKPVTIDVLANDKLGQKVSGAGVGSAGVDGANTGGADASATVPPAGTAAATTSTTGSSSGASATTSTQSASDATTSSTTASTAGATGGTSTQTRPPVAVPLAMPALTRFAPHGKEGYVRALVTDGDTILARYGINVTPMRLAHFMAQIGHESGSFTIERESLNYTTARRLMQVWPSRFPTIDSAQPYLRDEKKLAAKVYGGRMGNLTDEDAFDFRGRGLIQITGREAYQRYGRKLGIDLEADPELACRGDIALHIAALNWDDCHPTGERSMNEVAEDNKIDIVTKRINGGYTGMDDRLTTFASAWQIWGTGPAPVGSLRPDVLEPGECGDKVRKLQELLQRAGYNQGTADGKFGGGTKKAVALFQSASKLNVNGIADKTTWDALQLAAARRTSATARPSDRSLRQARRARPAPGDQTGSTPRRHGTRNRELLRLIAVLLGVAAFASLMLITVNTEGRANSVGEVMTTAHWLPAITFALAAVLWLSTLLMAGAPERGNSTAGNGTPDSLDASGARGTDPGTGASGASPDEEPEGPGDDRAANLSPAHTAADEAVLKKLGFDDSMFEDGEPVRGAPPLPEDGAPPPSSRPEQVQSLALTPGGVVAAARLGIIRPYAVSAPDARYAIIAMFGGDNNLSAQVARDLGEMAAGNRRNGVTSVLAIADLENAPASIVEITPGGQMRTLENLGEIDTGDPETLATFLARALVSFPNARKAIGFWDHGSGTFDEQDDKEKLLSRSIRGAGRSRQRPARRLMIPAHKREAMHANGDTRAMLHDNSGGVLTNLEAGHMLRAAFGRAGQRDQVDILYSDTCLNGMIEVIEELGDFARCVIASCETEPSDGWDYEAWLSRLAHQQPVTPEVWCKHAIEAFGTSYQTRADQHPCTLAAFRTANDITERFADLIETATGSGMRAWSLMNLARGQSQQYDSRDSYDLIDFAAHLTNVAQTDLPALATRAQALGRACREARIGHVWLGQAVQGSQGIAFWFPSSKASLNADIGTYQQLKFSQLTHWGPYLSSMYGGGGAASV